VPLGAVLPDELAVLAPVEEADEQRRAQEGQQEPDGGRVTRRALVKAQFIN